MSPNSTDRVRALISVHDVMPETLPQVARILTLLERTTIAPITLLVVPGRDWTLAQLQTLRECSARGHELAGHGWHHHIERPRGIYHHLHARFISRNVAEHLALNAGGIAELIARNHAWFAAQELPSPALYVPPAWAMGAIPRCDLADLPFTHHEYLGGVLSARSGCFQPIPMLGYEADTPLRAAAIRLWNRYNRQRAHLHGWLRIGIHPRDLDLHLAEDLHADLHRYRHGASYAALEAA